MRIAIIGAGFSGCQLAIELMRNGPSPLDISLFDASASFGPGVAFGARNDRLLLNTRVANMSALASDPSHFLRWLWAHDLPEHPAAAIPPSGHAFVARGVYGRYLRDVLDAAEAAAPRDVRLNRIGRGVVGLTDEHGVLWLKLDDDSTCVADVAVLCIGNLPPRLPRAPGVDAISGPRLIGNPWDEASIARIQPSDAVLVLGSGLTMVDVAILLADRGHRGPILALSRHGLLPREHAPTRRAPPSEWLDGPPTARGLLRQIRLEIARAERAGIDWRAVLDGWRERVPLLWHRLPMVERRRFLRHLRPVWDIHRHRMAPEIGGQIKEMQASGQLEVRAGTIEAYQAGQDGRRGALPEPGQQDRGPGRRRLARELRRPGARLPPRPGAADPGSSGARAGAARAARARPRDHARAAARGVERAAERQPVRARSADPGNVLGDDRRAGDPRAGPRARQAPGDERHRARRLGDARVLLARYATSCRSAAIRRSDAPPGAVAIASASVVPSSTSLVS